MSAYQDAVTAINFIASNRVQVEETRHELAALRALIDQLIEKLPAEKADYETDDAN